MKPILYSMFFSLFIASHCCEAINDSKTANPHIAEIKEGVQYLANRIGKTDRRYPSFLLALQLLKSRHAKVVVETGTARNGDQNFWGDGGSTIIFGDWAAHNQAIFYSVDITPGAIENAKKATQAYAKHIQFFCCDSIEFLHHFSQPIDFLYLDSYDFNLQDPLPSQHHHLNEIMAAYPWLHKNSVVMIDDCDLPHGGKGKLVIEYLTARGWKIVYKGYQVILVH
jgi:hypothetical protein